MKKYWPYILILVALGAGVGYFLYAYSPDTLAKKESDFGVHDLDDVYQIRLTTAKNETLLLTQTDKKWMVNGKYEPDEDMLRRFLSVIQHVEAKFPAPTNAQPIVLKDLAKQHVKCEISLKGDKTPSKVYYVGGPTADGTGTFMIMELDGKMATQSYVTHINGQTSYLTGIYAPMEERWRTKWVYRDNNSTIRSVKIEYHREHQKSFEITKVAKDSFVIANSEGKVEQQPKQKFIQQYLNFFESLSMESYENKNPKRDSILMDQPFCTVSLERNDGKRLQSILYYAPVSVKTMVKFDDNGRPLKYDIEHYYALINDKSDFVLMQYYVWGKALRSYDDFFRRPAQAAK
jgi:hypothetical protein